MKKEINGYHVLGAFVLAFGVIITVNLTMAFNAISTFPGVESANSYRKSQGFQQERAAQLALGWDVAARLEGEMLVLTIQKDGTPVHPQIVSASFGRATSATHDQMLAFTYRAGALYAPVEADEGNWALRLQAVAADGTSFTQRVIVEGRS